MHLSCSECGGATGSERLCVAVPCGHPMHLDCYEFLRKSVKLAKFLAGDDEILSQWQTNVALCPVCQTAITKAIPLFLNQEANPTSAGGRISELQQRLFHLQRKKLMRMKEFMACRLETKRVAARCAALHGEAESIQHSVANLYATIRELAPQHHENCRDDGAVPSTEMGEATIRSMSDRELRRFVQTTAQQVQTERDAIEALRKQLTVRAARLKVLRRDYDAQRVARAHVAMRLPASPAPPHKRPPQQACASHAHVVDVDAFDDLKEGVEKKRVVVVDVDAFDSSDSEVEVIAGPHGSAITSPPVKSELTDEAPSLLPCHTRQLPSYGLRSGRSLFDLPRTAFFQPTMSQLISS